MTIDEAIAHEKRISKDNKVHNFENIVNYHEQIAEWLEELKKYKEKPEGYLWDEAEMKGYNKAIDDFLSKAKEKKYHSHITYENCVSIAELDWLAKELKEGTNNGTDNQ